MLPAELIKKIKQIHIKCGRLANTQLAGQYRSVFRGSGVEFEEVREYAAGDDVKAIDWNVTARLGKPFVKLYTEERELIIMLLVDMSGSGEFGTTDRLKREAGVELAAVLAFNAIKNNDKVGALLFTDAVERYIPPKKGAAHVWRVIKEILDFDPVSRGTDLAAPAAYLSKVCRKRAVVFVISDFRAQGYEAALKRLAQRHDCIAARVSDPAEDSLPEAGILEVEDPETGRRGYIDCSDPGTRRIWALNQQRRALLAAETIKRANVDLVELATDSATVDILRAFFNARRTRRQ
jgi:uncharacterized protein (DUF58 family)